MPKSQNKTLPAFDAREGLIIEQAENGGWVVMTGRERGMGHRRIGAFTTPEDMVEALKTALCAPD